MKSRQPLTVQCFRLWNFCFDCLVKVTKTHNLGLHYDHISGTLPIVLSRLNFSFCFKWKIRKNGNDLNNIIHLSLISTANWKPQTIMEALPLPAKRPSRDNGEEVGAPKQLPFLVVLGDYFLVDQHHTRRFAQILSNTGNDFRSVWTAYRSAKKILYLGEISRCGRIGLVPAVDCLFAIWLCGPITALHHGVCEWSICPGLTLSTNNAFAMGRPTVKE